MILKNQTFITSSFIRFWLPRISFLVLLSAFLIFVHSGKFIIPNSFSLFGLQVYFYGLIAAVAVFVYWIFTEKLFEKLKIQLDLSIWLPIWLFLGVVGARINYVLLNFSEFSSFLDMVNLRTGGLVLWGAVLFSGIGIFFVAKRKEIMLIKLSDSLLVYLPLAHAITRVGNMVNSELYGIPTGVFWGQYIPFENSFVHPVYLYEMVGNIILFWIFRYYLSKNPSSLFIGSGFISSLYFVGYGILRGIINFYRDDSTALFISSSIISLVFIGFGVFLYRKYYLKYEN